jgi:hypothetical protein
MSVVTDGRRRTQPKNLVAAKKVALWVCFTCVEIVDIVLLPPRETFDRSFFMDIVLDSLKKKFTSIPG